MSKPYRVAPFELIDAGKANGAPNFKHVKRRKLCYYCKHAKAVLDKGFICSKHNLYFGSGQNAVANMAEFCCDDFAAD